MSILDGTLASAAGAPDTVSEVAKLAGMDAAATEQALMVLAQAHVSAGNTIENAVSRSGIASDTLTTVHEKAGGDAALDAIATSLSSGLRSLGQGNFFKELLPFG